MFAIILHILFVVYILHNCEQCQNKNETDSHVIELLSVEFVEPIMEFVEPIMEFVEPLSIEPLSVEPLSVEPLSVEPLSVEPLSVEPLSEFVDQKWSVLTIFNNNISNEKNDSINFTLSNNKFTFHIISY